MVLAADVTSVMQELDSVLTWSPLDVVLNWNRNVYSLRKVFLVK